MRLASPNLPVLAIKQTLEEVDRQLQVVRTTLRRASGRGGKVTQICVGLPEDLRREESIFKGEA